MILNPDFRSADEVIVPGDLSDLTGWTDGKVSEQEAIRIERTGIDRLEDDLPVVFRRRAPKEPMPAMKEKWDAFQLSKGRFAGSADLSLLDEFVLGQVLVFLAQIIGSCVISNTFRAYVIRQMWQVALLGYPQEYLGSKEFSPKSFAFYCAWSYGMARRRANMRGGDGLYCAPMAESLIKDAVIMCSTPKLLEITKEYGVDNDRDYPEPQGSLGARFYRAMGNWQYLDELKPFADFPVTDSEKVTNADQLWKLHQAGIPTFVCSSEAIKKIGEHKDGFAIHARDPSNTWAHNMGSHGGWNASDNERFFRWSNESWGVKHIYNRRYDEVERALKSGRLTMMSIGEVRSPESAPVFDF